MENFIIACVVAYFLGSIPFGLILSKKFEGIDVRKIGSGNIGATNVLRLGNRKLAAMVLLLDMMKAIVAVLFGKIFLGDWAGWAGLAAVVGHIYSPWLNFKGGKGVACGIGMYLGLSLVLGLNVMALWFGVAYQWRYSSLAAIASFAVAPFLIFFLNIPVAFLPAFLVSLLILYKHRGNYQRLKKGEENKISS